MGEMESDVVMSIGGGFAFHIPLLIEARWRLPHGSIAVL